MKVISHLASQESVVLPLVHAVGAKNWRTAAKILFVNSSILATSSNSSWLLLAKAASTPSGTQEVMELHTARGRAVIARLLRVVLPYFIPKMMDGCGEFFKTVEDPTKASKDDKRKFVAALIGNNLESPEFEQFLKQFAPSAPDVMNFCAAMVLEWIRGKTELQHRVVGQDHQLMVDQLVKLELAQPWLRASVCQSCLGQEVALSNYHASSELCGKCGKPWFLGEVFLLRPEFEAVKKQNQDLPLFMASYIRQSSLGEVEIYPEALVDTGMERIQVDVLVPEFHIGMECKVYADNHVVTNQKTQSIAGDLARHARGYAKAAIREYWACTNLSEGHAGEVEQALKRELSTDASAPTNVKVLPGSLETLLAHLDGLIQRLAEKYESDLQAQMTARAQKAKAAAATAEADRGKDRSPAKPQPKKKSPMDRNASKSKPSERRAGRRKL